MVIYSYPFSGVIFEVILHFFIIKNYPKLLSNYYHKFTFWVIYPFLCFYEKFSRNSLSLNITLLFERIR